MKYKILGMKQAKSNKGLIYEKKYKNIKIRRRKSLEMLMKITEKIHYYENICTKQAWKYLRSMLSHNIVKDPKWLNN